MVFSLYSLYNVTSYLQFHGRGWTDRQEKENLVFSKNLFLILLWQTQERSLSVHGESSRDRREEMLRDLVTRSREEEEEDGEPKEAIDTKV